MDLEHFRRKVREYRKSVSKTQEDLAVELGLAPVTLSNKLNGTNQLSLSRLEVKKIILKLAEWGALVSQQEAIELLGLAGFKARELKAEDWAVYPLNQLEVTPASLFISSKKENFKRPGHPTSSPSPFPIKHNIPPALTSFIGRDFELNKLKGLFFPGSFKPEGEAVRLVTLTGMGGIGKTRLALQMAGEVLAEPPGETGEIWFIELANLNDPGQKIY